MTLTERIAQIRELEKKFREAEHQWYLDLCNPNYHEDYNIAKCRLAYAAINILPDLLDRLEAVEKERDELDLIIKRQIDENSETRGRLVDERDAAIAAKEKAEKERDDATADLEHERKAASDRVNIAEAKKEAYSDIREQRDAALKAAGAAGEVGP